MAAINHQSTLVKSSEGTITVTDLPLIKWASASPVIQTYGRGDEVYHPEADALITLAEQPKFENLELTTPYLVAYDRELQRWLKTYRDSTNITAVAEIREGRYVFTKCSILQSPAFPGFNKNNQGTQTALKQLGLTLAVGDVTVTYETVRN